MKISFAILDSDLSLDIQKAKHIVELCYKASQNNIFGLVLSNQALIGAHAFLYNNFAFLYKKQQEIIDFIAQNIKDKSFVLCAVIDKASKQYMPCLIKKDEIIMGNLFTINNDIETFTVGAATNHNHFYAKRHSFNKADFLILLKETPLEILAGEVISHKIRLDVLKKINDYYKIPVLSHNMATAKDEEAWDGFVTLYNGLGYKNEKGCFNALFTEKVIDVSFTKEEGFDFCDSKGNQNSVELDEIIYKALIKAISNYYNTAGFNKVVVALSGGIDSAVVLTLAVKALGASNVQAVLMPGPYSSSHSVTDAQKLCENLAVSFNIININSIYNEFCTNIEEARALSAGDLTLQNIQARIRGTIAMAYTNKLNGIMLNTCNKSEDAVGYSTLYGDATGGFAPLADLYKRDVYKLGRYINKISATELIPYNIFNKAPSAELAPEQKDSDSLPEYDVLDEILHQFLDLNKDENEIALNLNIEKNIVKNIVVKIFNSEYKRRQSPPGVYFSPKGKGLNRKFSISGFTKEKKES